MKLPPSLVCTCVAPCLLAMAPASAQVTLNVSFDGTAVLKDTGIALDGVFADGFE